ncbi:MAG TPA: class I SAM-dependent methyltransferase [Planctomycetaceae bacterium]|nr:class I SAM-dependent methyltransferase [Planctomycetaceae bacterium]
MNVSLKLQEYSTYWQPSEDGVWRNTDIEVISYPSDGNDTCFRIEEDSFWFLHRNRIIGSLVSNFCSKGVFFDVGGGNGFVAKALQDQGQTTVLVEPGGPGVANAMKRGVINVVQSMWSPETVHAGVAAAVGLFDVVEHIEDDLQFLQGVRETLAPNGLVFITVPAFAWLWSNEDVHAGHFRRYTLSQLHVLLQKAGFHVEFSSYFFSPLTLPIFLLRSIPSFIGLRTKVDSATTIREHTQKPGMVGTVIGKTLSWEAARIARGNQIFVGSSCVIVGRKITGGE